jgi:hypothetical protein
MKILEKAPVFEVINCRDDISIFARPRANNKVIYADQIFLPEMGFRQYFMG